MMQNKMKQLYRVNEIFYSIQGEGHYSGYPSVFIRLSGCNLCCPWCDTDFSSYQEMSAQQIEEKVENLSNGNPNVHVVFTGGEPSLQLSEEEPICPARYICIETNGTNSIPTWINWVTVSPKKRMNPVCRYQELKFVFELENIDFYQKFSNVREEKWIQPLSNTDGSSNVYDALDFVLKHPEFKLSLQIHKLLGVR